MTETSSIKHEPGWLRWLQQPVSIAPLAVFRLLFGGLMLWSVLRFLFKGWIQELYLEPAFHFSYLGFEWVKMPGELGMYLLFGGMILGCLGILLGYVYRFSAALFFLCFTYVELIDKTPYLNHYYFVSLVAFLLIFLPVDRYASLRTYLRPQDQLTQLPRWMILLLQMQLAVVYVYAGLAKLHPDWLFRAMPMAIWLPNQADMPLLGKLFTYKATAFAFSWAGAIYDLSIPFLLWWKKSRPFAYVAVIVFHLLTWLMFPIGMFPWIMMGATLIFFPPPFHQALLDRLSRILPKKPSSPTLSVQPRFKLGLSLAAVFLLIQLLLPWRFLLYPGELFWHEQGYRFSWRVMLMEKNGTAFFTVKEPSTRREWEPTLSDYLTPLQEKMMSTQPDMILQFAHHLRDDFTRQGLKDPEVYARVYVSLNGRRSRLFIDPAINLAAEQSSLRNKTWILPFSADPSPNIATDR